MSSESLKTGPIHYNYLEPEKQLKELVSFIIILEKSPNEGPIKAFQFKNDQKISEIDVFDPSYFSKQDLSLIYLGNVEYVDKPSKKLMLFNETVIRYEKLIITSSSDNKLSNWQDDFNLALSSLIDAIRVSKKVNIDKMTTKEVKTSQNHFASKKNSDAKSIPLAETIQSCQMSGTYIFGKRHFELDL